MKQADGSTQENCETTEELSAFKAVEVPDTETGSTLLDLESAETQLIEDEFNSDIDIPHQVSGI